MSPRSRKRTPGGRNAFPSRSKSHSSSKQPREHDDASVDLSSTPSSKNTTTLMSPKRKASVASSEKKMVVKGDSQLNKVLKRVFFGFWMIAGFAAIIYAGHVYVWLLVIVLQTSLFRELVNVRYRAAAEKNIPWFRSIQWCWFAVAMLYSYGVSLYTFLKTQDNPTALPSVVSNYIRYHPWISFTLYVIIFVMSVLSLKKGYYKYQMGQLTWTLVTLGLIVFQMKYAFTSLLNGLFWLLFPASLVICNDIMAYVCGMTMGRKFIKHHFLKLSPKKTWEGFIGAWFFTMIFGFFLSCFLAQYQWIICPVRRFELFPGPLQCVPPAVFRPKLYAIPPSLAGYFSFRQVTLLPIQLHSLVFSIFASIVAPFGGFFASAIKRAYGLKDFDSIIPGHGGIMDRMDCQLITALFAGVYYGTFIRPSTVTIAMIMKLVERLSHDEQLSLLTKLQTMIQS